MTYEHKYAKFPRLSWDFGLENNKTVIPRLKFRSGEGKSCRQVPIFFNFITFDPN